MALTALRDRFSGKAAAATGLAAALAMTPLGAVTAQDAQPQQAEFTQVAANTQLVSDAGLEAGLYSEKNPGIAVAVYLGTHSTTPSQARIAEALTSDFREAGVTDPITFFFEQNDIPTSVASFFYDGALDGPYSLGDSRAQAANTARSYNFRKERGLLESVSYDR